MSQNFETTFSLLVRCIFVTMSNEFIIYDLKAITPRYRGFSQWYILTREQDNSPKNQLTHKKNGQLTQIIG